MTIKMCKNVEAQILAAIGKVEAESGGIFSYDKEKKIVDFYFDIEAGSGQLSYIPTVKAISRQVNHVWHMKGLEFAGIVHSHPEKAKPNPSKADIKMAKKIMDCNQLAEIILIVVQNKKLFTWIVFWDENGTLEIESCTLQII